MTKARSNLPETRASETDPPQIITPQVTTSAHPATPEELRTGRLGRRHTNRSFFGGGFERKKTRLWFSGEKETVVEDVE